MDELFIKKKAEDIVITPNAPRELEGNNSTLNNLRADDADLKRL